MKKQKSMHNNTNQSKLYKRRDRIYLCMMIPALICVILFWAIPLCGSVLAFKDYSFMKGIWGSDWVGLKHFKNFIFTEKFWPIVLNTAAFHTAEVLVCNVTLGAVFALILYEVRGKIANKIYQTAMLLPYFLSMTVIAYIVYLILNPTDLGVLNSIRNLFGLDRIDMYSKPGAWPFIIVGLVSWQLTGMACLYLYSALLSIDSELFDAAAIDGAGKLKQIQYISIPAMIPMICMTMITQLGAIMSANFELHYSVTRDAPSLGNVTNVISVYVYKGITDGSFGQTAAIGIFTSIVTILLTILTNYVVKKLSAENALF